MASTRGRRKDGRKKEPGTYLPEGGASPTGPGPLREWPAMVVFGCLFAALLTAALVGYRLATVLIAGTFVLAAILRLFLRDVGVLAVRSRFTDVAVLLFFGLGVLLLGLSIPEPLVDLPWVPKRTGQ
ncbi:DUF3017 domain-containing protein [Embleya sp. NBC_00896]|uniref:DUF3017 domain-containing protein n=1 Tax=Embleya sp. NBC_00896 TaxID=2975961 RepID=UPI003863A610|nr:DUF3017 domain-containing protein [Embleya sp. NBC_00896]